MRWVCIFSATALMGCAEDLPRLQTYGSANNPLCILWCEVAIETTNAEEGGATGGTVTQTTESKRK